MSESVSYVQAPDGVHLDPADVTATYVVQFSELSPGSDVGVWSDVPEARPRCRVRVAKGDPAVSVPVTKDGVMHHDPGAKLEVDLYEGDGYEQVRAEGEARWAAVDAAGGVS